MKKTRLILIATLVIIVLFCAYMQYKKMQFDTIYAKRDNYGMLYNDIYTSGKLDSIMPSLCEYFDTTINSQKGFTVRKFNLSYINDITTNKNVISIADYLIKKGFHRVELFYKDEDLFSFEISRTFLKYKNIPTRHYLIYNKNKEYEYRYSPNDYWFFYSSEKEPSDDAFLDFRPMWSMPYFEAFTFFSKNSEYDFSE